MAGWFGGPGGFPLKENWLLADVLHSGARLVSWLFVSSACA